MIEFRPLPGVTGELLESPVWDDRRNCLFLCDIEGGRIFQASLETGLMQSWDFDQKVASLGLCESGALVVALAREVRVFDPDSGESRLLWDGYDGLPSSRLNDGKVGADGAFWVGDMDGRPEREPIARLFRITADGRAEVKARGIKISNGLAWSADGRVMFHSDSRGIWLDRYSFDPATGALSHQRRLREIDEATGRPDGGAFDAMGRYWSAGVSAGVVNVYDQDGRILEILAAPVPAPTCPCFCGADLRQLVLTSHRQISPGALEDAPRSGGAFVGLAPATGAPVHRFAGL